jgi:hypothetical protein
LSQALSPDCHIWNRIWEGQRKWREPARMLLQWYRGEIRLFTRNSPDMGYTLKQKMRSDRFGICVEGRVYRICWSKIRK